MDSRKRLQYGASALFGVIFFVVALTFSVGLFRVILGQEGRAAADALSSLLNVGVVVLLVSAFGAAFYTIYLSRELDLLVAMPLKESAILSYKFWETLFTSSWLYAVFLLPAFVAYGLAATVSAGAVLLYYPTLVVVSVLLAMIPVGACIILIMPVVRLVPAGRLKELLAVVGTLLGIAAYFGFYWLFGSTIDPDAGPGGSAASSLRPLLRSPLAEIPPGSWAADTLSGAASLQLGILLSGLVPLVALSGVIYAACLIVARWAYATGRARASESGGRSRSSGPVYGFLGGLLRRVASPLPPGARAVAAKELHLLPRDLQRLSTAAMFTLIVSGGFLGNFLINRPELPTKGPEALLPYLAAAAIGMAFVALFSAQSVGIEGRSYWFVIASPLGPANLLIGKWASVVPLGAAAALVVSVVVTLVTNSFSVLAVAGIVLGTVGGAIGGAVSGLYGVGIAASFARFDWDNPNQATSQMGLFITMMCVIGLLVLGGLAALAAFLLSLVIPVWTALICGLLIWLAVGTIGGYAVASAGMASLKRMEWE